MSGINNEYRNTLKTACATIWGQKEAQAIYDRLFSQGITGTDCVANMLCMCKNFHRSWEYGEFVLYPHHPYHDDSNGNWTMDLVFYWLENLPFEQGTVLKRGEFLRSASEAAGAPAERDGTIRAVNVQTNAPILDGDIITIEADKQEELPDYAIVMLQYKILTMASLCGGAEPEELEEPSDDDEVDPVATELQVLEDLIVFDDEDVEGSTGKQVESK